jgi:hypothetical protein
VLPTSRDDAPTLARARRPRPTTGRRALGLAAGLGLATGLLAGCVQSDTPVNTSQVTAGGGTCKLPVLTVDPTSFDTGDKVTLKGHWFVDGCGGKKGLKPLTLISAVLTDSKGINFTFEPIDAATDEGTFETKVEIPDKAAAGAGRIIVGQAGPVDVMVKD